MPPINGARAWLQIGGFGIQPAEFAKTGTALLLARYISSLNIKMQNLQSVLVANTIILVPMILILLQPDAGTFVVFTSFLFVIAVVYFFISRIFFNYSLKHYRSASS